MRLYHIYSFRKNPNDPARFVNKVAVTNEGEKAKIHYYLDTDKIAEEEMYDGLYAVCTDLLDDDVADIWIVKTFSYKFF
jgi:hypothetical protein